MEIHLNVEWDFVSLSTIYEIIWCTNNHEPVSCTLYLVPCTLNMEVVHHKKCVIIRHFLIIRLETTKNVKNIEWKCVPIDVFMSMSGKFIQWFEMLFVRQTFRSSSIVLVCLFSYSLLSHLLVRQASFVKWLINLVESIEIQNHSIP